MTTTPQTNATLQEIAQVILDSDDFVICGHVSPDGDCLGSQLALWHVLEALGKRASCVLVRDEPFETGLDFMPGIPEMVPVQGFNGTCKTFVGVDVPNRERIGDAVRLLDASEVSITLDHHASETTMCDHVYVDPDSASASMIIWELAKILMRKPPLDAALCCYVGLATDTGGFRFQNCDVRAFEVASELVEHGVDPAYVAKWVFQTRSRASLMLEALVIDRMEVIAGGQAVISWVDKADFNRLGAMKADAEPLIDCIRMLEGIRVACILREQDDFVRGSFRSKDETDVSALARELGGGGHKAAAGFTLFMTLEEAKKLVNDKLVKLLEEA